MENLTRHQTCVSGVDGEVEEEQEDQREVAGHDGVGVVRGEHDVWVLSVSGQDCDGTVTPSTLTTSGSYHSVTPTYICRLNTTPRISLVSINIAPTNHLSWEWPGDSFLDVKYILVNIVNTD